MNRIRIFYIVIITFCFQNLISQNSISDSNRLAGIYMNEHLLVIIDSSLNYKEFMLFYSYDIKDYYLKGTLHSVDSNMFINKCTYEDSLSFTYMTLFSERRDTNSMDIEIINSPFSIKYLIDNVSIFYDKKKYKIRPEIGYVFRIPLNANCKEVFLSFERANIGPIPIKILNDKHNLCIIDLMNLNKGFILTPLSNTNIERVCSRQIMLMSDTIIKLYMFNKSTSEILKKIEPVNFDMNDVLKRIPYITDEVFYSKLIYSIIKDEFGIIPKVINME